MHYGLHPNAEIEFLTVTSDKLFHTLLELQSPDAVMGEGASQTLEEKVAVIYCIYSFFMGFGLFWNFSFFFFCQEINKK